MKYKEKSPRRSSTKKTQSKVNKIFPHNQFFNKNKYKHLNAHKRKIIDKTSNDYAIKLKRFSNSFIILTESQAESIIYVFDILYLKEHKKNA